MQTQESRARTPKAVNPAAGASNFRPLVVNFARREMRARYKRSLLGWLWSLINPLSTVLIYGLVFGVFLRTPPPITDNGRAELFAIYLFVGLVTWNFFSAIVNGCMDWLAGVMDLRKKVFFPTETAILGGTIATAVQSAFEVGVLLAIMIVFINIGWTFLLFPLILVGIGAFALGIGAIVSILNARYRDVRYLVNIALSLQFFLAPIVYPLDLLADEQTDPASEIAQRANDVDTFGLPARDIVKWNPVSQYVQAAHDVVYFQRVPPASRIAAMVVFSTVAPLVGLAYFRRRSMEISEEL